MKTINRYRKNKVAKKLSEELANLKDGGLYPFHMPGHKRNIKSLMTDEENAFFNILSNAYGMDITEIDGFDNLHDAKGIIKESEKRATKLYKSDETHFLVNGATSGILSAISAVSKRGQKIIIARNCHISVYNAVFINGLNPIYVYPDIVLKDTLKGGIVSSINKNVIKEALDNNEDVCAIVITSPTYDGILSDVRAIAKMSHDRGIPLIVDEAHGALFFIEGRSAVDSGADIVINSVHKTLPALTQTALIHLNGNIIDKSALRKYLRIYQTSSPSYILMGSIDCAVGIMEKNGKTLYRDFCIRTKYLKDILLKLNYLKYVSKDGLICEGAFDCDESKIIIATDKAGLSGKELYDILRIKYKLQPEMAAGGYVLLMTGVCDSDEGIKRLATALLSEDYLHTKSDISPAYIEDTDVIKGDEIGKPSEKTIYLYPPGIPVIVKGEIVTEEIYSEVHDSIVCGLTVKTED